tara:strand:- start:1243 stop:1809 length:567 start_codon:yes stop_codon:yes gene_type:complete
MENIDPVMKEHPFIKSIPLEITGIYEYSVFMLALCDGDIDLMTRTPQTERKIKKFNNILTGKITFYTSMTPKQRIKRMLLKAENFFTNLINTQPDMDTFTYNNQIYVVEYDVPDECYMEYSSCDKEERTYRQRANVFNISDVYLEESKDDNESESDDESAIDDENETEEDDYRMRLSGRGRRVRQRIR